MITKQLYASRRFPPAAIALMIAALLLGACGAPGAAPARTATPSPAPTTAPTVARAAAVPDYWPTTAWRTMTPEEQGLDSAQLLRALQYVDEAQINLRSLTVIRNGYIVLDTYYQPFAADYLYPVYSVTKSVTGLLTGIALHDGYLTSLRQPVLSFFPERTIANRDAAKEAITIEDLLTMQPGLDCADSKRGNTIEGSQDWVQSILDLPMANPPGKTFVYCSRAPHLLSAILTKATGMSTEAYAQARLFDPLGIRPADRPWGADPQGITIGGYGLALYPHDMAKLGLLMLTGGQWAGKQIVPADWIATASRPHAHYQPGQDYGYLFWVYPSHFAAEGLGDQHIMVVRDKNLVVVLTAANNGINQLVMQTLLTDYIIPAAKADGPLPPNPTAQASLQARVATLAAPVQPVAPVPAIATQIAGKLYTFPDNPSGWNALAVTFPPGSATARITLTTTAGVVPVAIGLDNVYRLNPQPNGGLIAVRGHWTGDHTFVAHELVMGDLHEYDIRLDFSRNQVAVHAAETVFRQMTADFTGTAP
jgi:CubicO group peptidase (beta-lactamase class C family)